MHIHAQEYVPACVVQTLVLPLRPFGLILRHGLKHAHTYTRTHTHAHNLDLLIGVEVVHVLVRLGPLEMHDRSNGVQFMEGLGSKVCRQ